MCMLNRFIFANWYIMEPNKTSVYSIFILVHLFHHSSLFPKNGTHSALHTQQHLVVT